MKTHHRTPSGNNCQRVLTLLAAVHQAPKPMLSPFSTAAVWTLSLIAVATPLQAGHEETPTFIEHSVSTNAKGARFVSSADVDGDGDIDLLSASSRDDKIAWYENDGNENFSEHLVSNNADFAQSVSSGDVDGDVDLLSASRDDNTVAWYENERFWKV